MSRSIITSALCVVGIASLVAGCPGKKVVSSERGKVRQPELVADAPAAEIAGKEASAKANNAIRAGGTKKTGSKPTKAGVTLLPDVNGVTVVATSDEREQPGDQVSAVDAEAALPSGMSLVVTVSPASAATPASEPVETPAATQAGAPLADALPVDAVDGLELAPDTTYEVQVLVDDRIVDHVVLTTLAAEPEILAATVGSDNRVTLTIDVKDNPPETSYVIAAFVGGDESMPIYFDPRTGAALPLGVPVVGQALAGDGPTREVVLVGLSGDPAGYTFGVLAMNGEGVETAWSDPVSVPGGVEAEGDDSDEELWADDHLAPDVMVDADPTNEQDLKLKALRSEIKALRAELAALGVERKKMRSTLKTQRAALRDMTEQYKRLERQKGTSESDLKRLGEECKAAQKMVASSIRELDDNKERRSKVKSRTKQLLRELKEIRADQKDAPSAASEKVDEHKSGKSDKKDK